MALWSTAEKNNLPDSSFLYVEPGGEKDSEGKTTPRSKRHFPVKNKDGKVDLPHLRDALARIPTSDAPDEVKAHCKSKAEAMLREHGGGSEMKGKSVALTGLATALTARGHSGNDADLWIVYLPKGDVSVDQRGDDGQLSKLRVNPSPLSAKRMEAARRLVATKGGNQPYTDFNHDDREASGKPLRFAWHDDLGVIGLTRRTPAALKATTGDPPEFQAFSPHVPIDPESGEAVGLYMNCGGFVNRPLFGDSTSLSAAAHLSSELVAADPNAVELVAVAPDDEETIAADKERKRMEKFKALIASLCAAYKIMADGKTEEALATELNAAFETERSQVGTLTARAALAEPVIVALGFDKTATPKPEELTAKMNALSQPGEVAIAKRLVGFAVKTGLIAPAEEADWNGKMERDPKGWTDELIKKTPSVLIGKVLKEHVAGVDDKKGATVTKFEERVKELCASDPVIAPIAKTDLKRARSMATERIAAETPSLMKG